MNSPSQLLIWLIKATIVLSFKHPLSFSPSVERFCRFRGPAGSGAWMPSKTMRRG